VQKLVTAKGRTRAVPPPVLVPGIPTLDALAAQVPDAVRDLVAEFWPGALTIILTAQPSLEWDLGDTAGTVALRMPDHRIALELLSETGPLAVSSANRHGEPAATTAQEAESALGESVAVILDAGTSGKVPSTIIDATGLPDGKLRIVREGLISRDQIVGVVGEEQCA
jgi:tRNA threonylcarbamoyl adenosine modification protein (Sua5/YciO/YrdC/YwlC family)